MRLYLCTAPVGELTANFWITSYPGVMTPASQSVEKNDGTVDVPSNRSVDETIERLKNILQTKEITLSVLIDHSANAVKAGVKMRPTKLLIFGSPKVGTPLMLAAPSIAIGLPPKLLVWEDAKGKVWVSYNSPEYLAKHHNLPQNLLPNVAVIGTLAAKAAE